MDFSRFKLPRIFSKVVVKATGEVGVFHGVGMWGHWKVKLIGNGFGQSLWRTLEPNEVSVPLSDLTIQRKRQIARRFQRELETKGR